MCLNSCGVGGVCSQGQCLLRCTGMMKPCVIGNSCIPMSTCCADTDCKITGEKCPMPGGACECPTGQIVCSATKACIHTGTCCTSADCADGGTCPTAGGSCQAEAD